MMANIPDRLGTELIAVEIHFASLLTAIVILINSLLSIGDYC